MKLPVSPVGLLLPALFLLVLLPSTGRTWDRLDIDAELRRSGVRLVVLEFYADWCAPCKKAVPQWNELHKRYRDRGLRLIVVSVGDGGSCANPGWQPDKVVCDLDGSLQTAYGASSLPQAFLYSWQGSLLVRNGHYEEVERAVEDYFHASPRILVGEPEDEAGKPVKQGAALREMVRTDLKRLAKFELVASKEERQLIQQIRKEGFKLEYDDKEQCRLGLQVSANSALKIRLLEGAGDNHLLLQLFSVESGCMLASARARVGKGKLEAASFEAVGTLVDQLIGREQPVESAGAAIAVAPDPPAAGSPQSWDAPVEEIAQLRREAEAYRRGWAELEPLVNDENLSLQARMSAIAHFQASVRRDSPYWSKAEELKARVPGTAEFAAYRQTRTEWFNLFFTITPGPGYELAFFNLRWKSFYLHLLRHGGRFLHPDLMEFYLGTGLGHPIPLGSSGRHELRLGGDFNFFHFDLEEVDSCEPWADEKVWMGTSISPHATYVFHAAPHFSFQAGLFMWFGLFPYSQDGADEECEEGASWPLGIGARVGFGT